MSWQDVRRAWMKWLADLASTRTQIVVVLFVLHIWAWADVLLRPHSPSHVVDLLRITVPFTLSGILAWAGVKALNAYAPREDLPQQDRGGR